jgi:hypothetical protein
MVTNNCIQNSETTLQKRKKKLGFIIYHLHLRKVMKAIIDYFFSFYRSINLYYCYI